MLSKSDFLIFLDTPLHLWALKHNQYHRELTELDKQVIQHGREVEDNAKRYIEQYISKDYEYQKRFETLNTLAITDFTVLNKETNKYDIYEIKSSTDVKLDMEFDVSFQYFTASQVVDVGNIYLVHLNKNYLRDGELNLRELFVVKDMTDIAKHRFNDIEILIEQALTVLDNDNPSDIEGCYKPKTCPSLDLCYPQLPEHSIYELANLDKTRIIRLKEAGIIDMNDIPDNFDLGHRQRLQIQSLKENRAIIDQEKLTTFLNRIKYPIYFLDYESYSWAIPKYNQHKVYQPVVFQYSLHKQQDVNTKLDHYEYVSTNKEDITKELVVDLLKHIGDEGSILVWNKQFEMGCNREMARIYPEYAERLRALNNRVIDLGDIFSKQMYVDYKFHGSWSIKNVLPVLINDLDYSKMDIGNGIEAMNNWNDLVFNEDIDPITKEKIKQNLLKYCGLDTYAMVEILNMMKSKIA
ncbi:MAG TPA: DUF2779 domain-containing protein [Candidatus Dojkabacteria bacterium]|nr:DUF2779 domain-containing protein [Candidatus Dojkabacteria bacterium]